jgi:hypothetical protein
VRRSFGRSTGSRTLTATRPSYLIADIIWPRSVLIPVKGTNCMNRRWLACLCFIALALATRTELFAQVAPSNSTKVAEITTKGLIVNGRLVPTVVVRIDNRIYVSLEDLSSALNGAVTLKGDVVIALFGADQPTPESAGKNSGGGVRGTLTYFFNSNQGNLPDTGAEVALVPGRLDVPSGAVVLVLGPEITIGEKNVQAVKTTAADGSGNFSLEDLPPGEYTVLLKSNHAKGATSRDFGGKIRTEFVTVESGKTLDMSEDFGASAF